MAAISSPLNTSSISNRRVVMKLVFFVAESQKVGAVADPTCRNASQLEAGGRKAGHRARQNIEQGSKK